MGDSSKSTTPDIINVNHLLVRKAQEAMRESKRQQKILLDHSLANHEVAARIYHSALLLLAANTRQEIAQIIRSYLPPILDVAGAGLLVAKDGILAEENVGTPLTPSFLRSLTAKDGIFLGAPNKAHAQAFTAAALEVPASAAFIALPQDLPAATGAAVLMLGGKAKDSFAPSQGAEMLMQLTTKIAVALAARAPMRPASK